MFRVACLVLIFGTPTRLLPQAQAQAVTTPAAAVEAWNGSVSLPGGGTLDFSVALTPSGGTIDIPTQHASGLTLVDVAADGKVVKFTLKPPGAPQSAWARFEATADADGQTASGFLHQAGMDLPLKMTRAKEGEAKKELKRPQEPKPPFPYNEREVTYVNPADGTKLAGTLAYPKGDGKFPAVIMITGSGAQDRNESLMGHKPFLVIADHLTRHGFAVLRVDDRGVGGSSGTISESTSADFAGDVLAGVEFLARQPEVDAGRIGLIGHSEGGLIAPMVASRSDKVAFIVLLAGTGLPGREIIKLQSELIGRVQGGSEVDAKAAAEVQDQIFDLLAGGADESAIRAKIREIGEQQIAIAEASADPKVNEQVKAARSTLDATVQAQTKELSSKWFRYFLTLDPRIALRTTKCPVLALNGGLDLQVPPRANLPEIQKALAEAGNHDVTVTELPGLNHLFQTCTTGSPSEYATIEETFSPAALEVVLAWLRQHAHMPVESPVVAP